jgi:hypothetical protein
MVDDGIVVIVVVVIVVVVVAAAPMHRACHSFASFASDLPRKHQHISSSSLVRSGRMAVLHWV